MRQAVARKNYLMLHEDGAIHYPFSKFLTDMFSNPNSRELAAQSLRILDRFSKAHRIELALRAIEGRCLTYDEAKNLGALCYRPLPEIESMGDKKIVLITSAKAGKAPKDLPDAIEPNTASKRMHYIAKYLKTYLDVMLLPHIRSSAVREELKYEYDKTCHQLRTSISGTKQNHHHNIKSLPTSKFLGIIEAVVIRPEDLFLNESGKVSRTILRDRAMTLLSCEGLRPGMLGNIARADFRPKSGHLVIIDNRAKRTEKITTGTPLLKMGDTTQVNNASETMIQLWPFTVKAIQEYIDIERSAVLMKRLKNNSDGFLFLNSKGQSVKHRASISGMFNRLGLQLTEQGLLDIGDDPYFLNKKQYDFYGYVLRHSAASFFLAHKTVEYAKEHDTARPIQYMGVPDRIKDEMKHRFGWTKESNMPELYAARALSDNGNIILMEFNQRLLNAVRAKNQSKDVKNGI
ncbi:hypothetical protein GTP46_27995 [Duganella sp. FT135W]|uniref:Site-specific integrase n=1 Tax=Duganella flavida TaxID=2692175 RepID=A0A6L8KH90_9BURK|nr:hypothetical protein [Duganella flavida]MYM26475.1 hypothetical protein [Duganella flavida]